MIITIITTCSSPEDPHDPEDLRDPPHLTLVHHLLPPRAPGLSKIQYPGLKEYDKAMK